MCNALHQKGEELSTGANDATAFVQARTMYLLQGIHLDKASDPI